MDPHPTPTNLQPSTHDASEGGQSPAPSAALGPVRNHEDVLALISDVEHQLERLRTVQSHVQSKTAEELAIQAERIRQIDEREASLRAAEALLIARQAQLVAQAEATEAECRAERTRVGELEAQARAAMESASATRAAEQTALAEERTALERAAEDLAQRIETTQRDRERTAAELAQAKTERDEAGARADEAILARDAALAAAESLRGELERVREALADAESSLGARDAVVDDRDRAIDALRVAIAEVERDATARGARIADLERSLSARDAELESTRANLRLAGQKLANLAESVAAHAPELERGAAAAIRLTEQEAELQRRREEIEALRRELAARQVATAEQRDAVAAEDGVHQERLRQLDLATKFLRTRKRRLDRARQLRRERIGRQQAKIRETTEGAVVRAMEERRIVESQREELRQVQEMLEASERRLLSRASRHRGVFAAAWCALAVGALAAASWVAAGEFSGGDVVASVDLVARGREGAIMSPETDAVWQSAHREALSEKTFRDLLQRRFADRGVRALANSGEFESWVEGVRFDSDGPGSLRLVAGAADPETAVIALDTLATSLANESSKLIKGHGDIPRASVAGASQLPGRVTFSTLVPYGSHRNRLIAAGIIFAAIATFSIIVGCVVAARLAKAKRRFEDTERFGATV